MTRCAPSPRAARERRGAGHVRGCPPGARRDAGAAHRPPPPDTCRRRPCSPPCRRIPAGLGRVYRDPETGRRGAHHRGARPAPGAMAPSGGRGGRVRLRRRSPVACACAAISNDNAQGEYYLPDVLPLLGGHVEAMLLADPVEALGINDRCQLAEAEAVLRTRVLDRLMAAASPSRTRRRRTSTPPCVSAVTR